MKDSTGKNKKRPHLGSERHPRHKVLRDFIIVIASIAATLFVVHSGALDSLIRVNIQNQALGSFIAGLFFSSAFTIAPATVVLTQLAHSADPYSIALWAAVGSVISDLVIFKFIKNNLSRDAEDLIKHSKYKRLLSIFHLRFFRWSMPFIGALMMGLPFPDEIGLALMGVSRISVWAFMLIDFVMSYIGILTICLIARSL